MNIQNFAEAKTNLLSGLTVALALVPEAIAFALVAHVHPLVGAGTTKPNKSALR